jgi:hypothetical protein
MVTKRLLNTTTNSKNQFTISYELLTLLQWLATHEEGPLKKIVKQSLQAGLHSRLRQQTSTDSNLADTIQFSIVEFFALLEALLLETVDEMALQDAIQHNLLPAIDRIDASACDDETLRVSIEKTTAKLARGQQINAQEQLFREILKQWRPHKKAIKH